MEGNQYHPRIVASSEDPDPDGFKGANPISTSIDQEHRFLGSTYFKSAQWYDGCSIISQGSQVHH